VLDRWAPWLAGLVLVAGVASYTATRLAGASPKPAAAPASTAEATVPLDPQARATAQEFVATAVARRRLDRAWQLAAPSLRGHLTLAEWRTGSIPIQPYPVAEASARYRVETSHPDDALLEVTFLPRKGAGVEPAQFLLGLQRVGGRWLVSSWAPRSSVAPGR